MSCRTPSRNRVRCLIETLEARSLLSGIVPRVSTAAVAGVTTDPVAITAGLSPKSDLDGNGVVVAPAAIIEGTTAPRAVVRLDQTAGGSVHRVTRADALGRYNLKLRLPSGRESFHITADAGGGRTAATDLTFIQGDVIVEWNTAALNAVRTAGTNPPYAARNLAMVQTAVFDAVNSIDRRYQAYAGIQVKAARGASQAAAVASAADTVLRSLYPAQSATFDATLAECLSAVPFRTPQAQGFRVGKQVGEAILALRADDGSKAAAAAPTATKSGEWSPTPPKFGPAVALNFAMVTPFAMTSPSQFRPGSPPDLASSEYAAAYNEVKAVGSVNSTTRTADQTAYAHFWADLPGSTFTPPGHWNQIAQDAALSSKLNLSKESRLFALLDIALADAGISCWETKSFYDAWRPVTAIRAGNGGINAAAVGAADPTWTPLWATPAFSSYTSGHATFSAAAAAVLGATFGSKFAFTDHGDPHEKVAARRFTSFAQAAAEAAASRMYGGIHFRFDNETGLAVGKQIGSYVLANELKPVKSRAK